jgi:hypothetical protein
VINLEVDAVCSMNFLKDILLHIFQLKFIILRCFCGCNSSRLNLKSFHTRALYMNLWWGVCVISV